MTNNQRLIFQLLQDLTLLQYAVCCNNIIINSPDYSLPLPPPAVSDSECTVENLLCRLDSTALYLKMYGSEQSRVAFQHIKSRAAGFLE